MNENENVVVEQTTEAVEQTTEETPKTYTEAEFNAKLDEVLGRKIAREKAKLRKEYDREYGELTDVLKAGMGKEDMGEITNDLREFYSKRKGIKIEKRPEYSAKDLETLARAEADEIIGMGYDEVVDEYDRLTRLGAAKMNAREKAVYKALAEHKQNADKTRELSSIGVTEDVYNSKEFKEFQSKFNPNTPIRDIYDIYNKTTKKEFKSPGSMKSTNANDNGVKDFYTYEESLKFTKKDFDKNPALFKAVCDSMAKW